MSRSAPVHPRQITPDAAEEILFKPDRPRHIDQFINFFGGADAAATDTHGEQQLSTFEEDDD